MKLKLYVYINELSKSNPVSYLKLYIVASSKFAHISESLSKYRAYVT